MARFYQLSTDTNLYTWTLPSQTVSSIASAVAQFRPSFLSSITRVEVGNTAFPTQMISDLNSIYATVKSANPSCLIDVELRGSRYSTASAMITDMQATAASGISFDAFSTTGLPTGDSTTIFQAAQALGKPIGGYFTSESQTPPGYFPLFNIFADTGFLPLDDSTSAPFNGIGVPVLFQNANGASIVTTIPSGFPQPTPSQTEHNYFVLSLTPQQQLQIMTTFAQGQIAGGYAYMYPLVFPEGTIGIYADYIAEGIMPNIIALANQYNSAPR